MSMPRKPATVTLYRQQIRTYTGELLPLLAASSDDTPGFALFAHTADEARALYKAVYQKLGAMPLLESVPQLSKTESFHEKSDDTHVHIQAHPHTDKQYALNYLGFATDKNYGDRWVYRAIHNALARDMPSVQFLHRRGSDGEWARALPHTAFDGGILGGGTLLNQKAMFYIQAKAFTDTHTPIGCFGTGVGSVERWGDHRLAWLDLLQHFFFIGVRGPLSRAALLAAIPDQDEINALDKKSPFAERIHVVGDTCLLDFWQKPWTSLRADRDADQNQAERPVVLLDVSFGLCETPQTTFFRFSLLSSLYYLYRQHKIDLRFFSTWKTYQPWTYAFLQSVWDVTQFASQKKRDVPNWHIHLLDEKDPPNLRNIFQGVHACVAYRLHAGLSAQLAGIPTWIVDYEDHKAKDMWMYLELPEMCLDPSHTNINQNINAWKSQFLVDLEDHFRVRQKYCIDHVEKAAQKTKVLFGQFQESLASHIPPRVSDSGSDNAKTRKP